MPLGGGGLTGSPGAVTHTLQADFSGTAFGGSPTWTDITGYWMSAGSDPGGSPATEPWGRQDQSSTVESSSTSFVLNNADGRFTPGKVSSPYYPNVKRRVRMRHTITDGTTTLTMFDGYVDSWTVTVQTNGPTLATVSLSDGFARLSVSTLLRAMVVEEMLVDAPDALYPLDEAAGSTSAGDASAHLPAVTVTPSKYRVNGTYAFGVDNGRGGTGLHLTGSGTDGYSLQITGLGDITANATTIVISFSTTATAAQVVYAQGDFVLQLDSTGHLTRGGTTGAHALNDGLPHTVVIRFTIVLGVYHSLTYVDGVFEADFSGGANSSTAWLTGSLGQIGGAVYTGTNHVHAGTTSYGPFFNGVLWNFGHYNTLLTTTRVTDYQTAATTAFAGESTSARWARLLRYRPNLGGTTSGTVGTVGAGDTAGLSMGDALTETATAEGGVIQTNRGSNTLIGRSNWYDPATTLTLDASNGEVDLPTTWRDDTQALLNDVTVSRPNGASQRSANTASTTGADGIAQTSITANVNSDRDAADMAGWLVAVGVREQLDSPTLTINLYARSSAALTMAVCALKTYDVVTLTNLPAAAPATTMSFQVQGGTYTVGADTFTAELYTTTMPPTVLQVKPVADAYTRLDTGNVIAW